MSSDEGQTQMFQFLFKCLPHPFTLFTIHPIKKRKHQKANTWPSRSFFLIKVRQQSGANNNNNRQTKKLDWKPPPPHHHHHHQIFIHLYEENRKATRPFHCIRQLNSLQISILIPKYIIIVDHVFVVDSSLLTKQ